MVVNFSFITPEDTDSEDKVLVSLFIYKLWNFNVACGVLVSFSLWPFSPCWSRTRFSVNNDSSSSNIFSRCLAFVLGLHISHQSRWDILDIPMLFGTAPWGVWKSDRGCFYSLLERSLPITFFPFHTMKPCIWGANLKYIRTSKAIASSS